MPSAHDPELHADHGAWQEAVRCSDVRLQWDPDHGPRGEKLSRRALQLGLRGIMLRRYAREWVVGIEDVSPLVAEQRATLAREGAALITPREEVYPVSDPAVAARLKLSSPSIRYFVLRSSDSDKLEEKPRILWARLQPCMSG